jgi:hypothetical protein
MFAVYCPRHASRVLLFTEHITEIVNRPDGIDLRWRCPCGAAGTEHYAPPPAAAEKAA